MSLMVSISGIRGVVGESLTPEVIVKYTSAFAEYCNHGPIVIGRDGRVTGKVIANIVASTLVSMGCKVVALGIAPTPTIALAVEEYHAAGGISITASHNPMQWNGLKFIGSSGMFLNAAENAAMWKIANAGVFQHAQWNGLGAHQHDETMLQKHIDRVLTLPFMQPEAIRKRRFKVVLDCINAAGGVIVPQMLRQLDCEVVEMNCDVSGVFARMPEPVPENLGDVCERVRSSGADLGIVVDPDVDRLVFINEKGEPFGEEYTVTAATKFILGRLNSLNPKASVVVNLSTTRAVEDVAAACNATVYRTPVGEINVAAKMKEVGALVGGEGSGGVILPAVHYGRDAIVGIGVMLQQLVDFGGTVSELRRSLPSYHITKSKIDVAGKQPEQRLQAIQEKYSATGRVNTDDGLKIDFADSWVHLRKSNTEPIIRIIAEAPTSAAAEELVRKFQKEFT